MYPIPTLTFRYVAAASTLMVGVGILLRAWPAVTLGIALWVGIAISLSLSIPLGRQIRRHKLEFAWWLAHGDPGAGGGAVVPGKPFDVRCFLRHRANHALTLTQMTPLEPGGTRLVGPAATAGLSIAPNTRVEFSFTMVAPAAGRVVLHGLAVSIPGPLGLFETPLYFPNPLAIKVLPQAAAQLRGGTRILTGLPIERSGRSMISPTNSGTDLRELRELNPGDPFKSIAWKASARFGRLMVRDVEQEAQQTRYVVCDVSGTMRGGEPGRRKLDFIIEAAASEARRAIQAGDRIGLLIVDGRILTHLTPNDGRPHLLRVFDALLDATETVDEDLTDIDDDEVAQVVGRYLREQDGIDYRNGDGQWNVPLLIENVTGSLGAEDSRKHVRASSTAGATLRRFCRARGIPLPYRPDPRDGSKGPGLADALKQAAGNQRVPMSFILLTDLDGMHDTTQLARALQFIRSRRHAMALIVPHAPSFAPAPKTPLQTDVAAIFTKGEERRFQQAQRICLPLRIPVLHAKFGDPPGLTMMRAQTMMNRVAA